MNVDALSARTTSTYPLSIGTSLTMESIALGKLPAYDQERVITDTVELSHYSSVYINLVTLHRNIIGAVGSEAAVGLKPKDVATTLSDEVEVIREIIHSNARVPLKLVFYVCGNEALEKHYPHAQFRQNTTEKQKESHALMQSTLSQFFKTHMNRHVNDTRNRCEIIYDKGQLSIDRNEKVLLLTHQAIDLLIHQKVHTVDLLESHTGVLKSTSMFHTKFHEGKGLIRIPFIDAMLVIFGDSQTFIPWKKVVRQEIIELAEKYKWNYKTTKTRIRVNLNSMKDVLTRDIIITML